MKKLLIFGMVIISGVSFARDFTHNARRDLVKPQYEKEVRISRFNLDEYNNAVAEKEANIAANKAFHDQLRRADNRGEESER